MNKINYVKKTAAIAVCAIMLTSSVVAQSNSMNLFSNASITVSAAISTANNLQVGSSGTQVKYLQTNLNVLNYNAGTADGVFGSGTKSAVIRFQNAYGLSADGIAGKDTINKMNSITTQLQNDLNSLGYNCGTADGILGANTVSAIKSFQSKNGLTSNGIANSATLKKISDLRGTGSSTKPASKVVTYSKAKNGNQYLSTNFKVSEFACKDGTDKILIDNQLVYYLQKIRDHFGAAVTISSAYRTASHNTAVGGATGSQHLLGKAADIYISGVTPKAIAAYAKSIGVKGIGTYSGFVHIDTRTTPSYWNG